MDAASPVLKVPDWPGKEYHEHQQDGIDANAEYQ
jgi:hypothetical protein